MILSTGPLYQASTEIFSLSFLEKLFKIKINFKKIKKIQLISRVLRTINQSYGLRWRTYHNEDGLSEKEIFESLMGKFVRIECWNYVDLYNN